jgi:hypothetical protein
VVKTMKKRLVPIAYIATAAIFECAGLAALACLIAPSMFDFPPMWCNIGAAINGAICGASAIALVALEG